MPRDIPVSNGSLLICFDRDYQIRDIFFPHIGLENHAGGYPFRFGIWVDGKFTWITDASWHKSLKYRKESLVTEVKLSNHELQLNLICHDFVDYYWNFYAKKIHVQNLAAYKRDVRLFFHHDFRIYGTEVGDTGFYDPVKKAVIHYKGRRYFLAGLTGGIEHFSIGAKALGHAEGTWRDAEDGHLQDTVITHGSVDSTIGKYIEVPPEQTVAFSYWLCVGKQLSEVSKMHDQLQHEKDLDNRLNSTEEYWRLWVNKESFDLTPLPVWAQDMFKKSLLILRTQIDHGGAILAANDSDVQLALKDHYSYVWPRDGALVAHALDQAHYQSLTQRFYTFMEALIQPDGYLMHKYNPRGAIASSWHPWVRNGKPQLPIQEDETALVLWSLWEHFRIHRDVEFVRGLYESLIIKAADFLLNYRDSETKLPLPSFDLWEERKGVMTFTCCTVEAGLRAAANFAKAFGDENYLKYVHGAKEVKEAIVKHLYDSSNGRYLRGLVHPHDHTDELIPDSTVDSSLFALFRFGTFSVRDHRVRNTMQAYRQKLWVQTEVGGIARYQNDWYHIQGHPTERIPGNPWIICILWLMTEEIMAAESEGELTESLKYLDWVRVHSLPSGVLPEQVNPYDGSPLSVSPLTWSHATVVDVIMLYLKKLKEVRQRRNVMFDLHKDNSGFEYYDY